MATYRGLSIVYIIYANPNSNPHVSETRLLSYSAETSGIWHRYLLSCQPQIVQRIVGKLLAYPN
jgi:hypothetical protein